LIMNIYRYLHMHGTCAIFDCAPILREGAMMS